MVVTKVGIIGCGNISRAYARAAEKLAAIDIVTCADLSMDAATRLAEEFGYRAQTIDELLSDPEVEIVINLTIPQAHAEVNRAAMKAGKHVHCEKPFALTREDGREVLSMAARKNLYIGSAPDTFLGGGLQTCRKLIDDGALGRVTSGTAVMACPGHEHWHPNPGFYYQRGGGPMLDMGPYYITALVHLLGPVRRVTALGGKAHAQRTATSEGAKGQVLPVEINTHITGVIEFTNGALITIIMSFDTIKHTNHNIELHGTEGSLSVPDPNHFGGEVKLFKRGFDDWQIQELTHGQTDNMRSIGVADMALAIRDKRDNRCSGRTAYHVLDVMLAFEESTKEGRAIEIESTCVQPAAVVDGEFD